MTKLYIILALCLAVLCLAGCVSDQTRQDVANSATAIDYTAQSLPPSPQTAAIESNAVAIASAMGHPVPAPAAPVAPAIPAPVKAIP